MELFRIFLENFNIFTPIFMAFALPLGIYLGLWLARPKKNQVCKILIGDKRGYDLDILQENAVSLECNPHKRMPPQRFLRYRSGFTIDQQTRLGRKRKITRYFAKIGTAFTKRMESGILTNVSLADTLRTLWGNETYEKMRDELKAPIEAGKIGVTIQLEDDPDTPEGLHPISEENIKQEEDRQAAATLWAGRKEAMKTLAIQSIFPIGLGFGIAIVLCLIMGWIPVWQPPSP